MPEPTMPWKRALLFGFLVVLTAGLARTRWVKAGIELSDGRPMQSSMLTDGRSDWATAPFELHDLS